MCDTIKDGTNKKPIFSTTNPGKDFTFDGSLAGYGNNTTIFSTTDPDKDFVFNARTQEKYNIFFHFYCTIKL